MKDAAANGDLAGVDAWKEGGANRALMQGAGAALVTALAGGNAVGGAAGSAIASIASCKLNELSSAIAGSDPTGNANMNEALGNIVANALATGAGAAVGGESGAFSGYNVDRFNRQLHPEEKTLAKQLAEKSKGKYTQAQIEDQMRVMGVSVNGKYESGAPTTVVGEMPTDSGAKWISGGATSDGKPIWTQKTAQANPGLQQYIIANANSATNSQVPSQFTYDRPGSNGWGFNVTGPLTKFDQSDANYVRNTSADAASMISTNAGRVGAIAGAMSSIPSPGQAAAAAVGTTSSAIGLGASAIEQALRPNLGAFTVGFATDMAAKPVMDRLPFYGPIINEILELWKNSTAADQIKNQINR